MFKEQYKNANDSIPVNEELLKELLAKAEKPARTIRFKTVFKYGTAIAAALILAVSLYALPRFTKSTKKQDSNKSSLAAVTENAENKSYRDNLEVSSSDSYKEAPDTKVQRSNDSAADSSPRTSIENSEKESEKILTDESSEINPIPDAPKAESELDENALSSALASADGFSAPKVGGQSVFARSVGERISIDEYLEMFGFDLKGIVLPEGVMRQDDFIYASRGSDGNFIFSEFVIAYSGKDKNLTLTVSRDTDFVSDMIAQNSISSSSENTAIKDEGNGFITAYIKNGNNAYIANCRNFSVNEALALAGSLK